MATLSRFLAARFTRKGAVGLHLTLGLLLALLALRLFAGLTEDVVNGEAITKLDTVVLGRLRQVATPTGDSAFFVVSMLGSPAAMGALGLLGAAWLGRRRDWVGCTGWIATFAGAGIVDLALKYLVHRPRPLGSDAFVGASFSFPSGHALGSLCGYGVLSYMTILHAGKHARVPVVLAAALLVLAIGFSRLYLGVHYLSDVMGGYSAGTLWLSLCVSALEVDRRRKAG